VTLPPPVADSGSADRRWLLEPTLVRLFGSGGLYFLALGLTVPTLPLFVVRQHGNLVEVGVAVSAFSAAALVARPFLSPALTRASPRTLIVAGSLIVGAFTAGLAVSDSVWTTVTLRAAAGVGEASMFVVVSVAVFTVAPPHSRAVAQSYFSAVIYGSILVGAAVGVGLQQRAGFDAVWLAALGLCVAAAICAPRLARASERPRARSLLMHRAAIAPGLALAALTIGWIGYSAFLPIYSADQGLGGVTVEFALLAAIILGVRLLGVNLIGRLQAVDGALAAVVLGVSGLMLLAAAPTRIGLLAATVMIGVSQALAYPLLLTVAGDRAGANQRTAAISSLTAFYDVAVMVAGTALGAIGQAGGLRGLYVTAALITVLGAAPLCTLRLHSGRAVASAD